MFDDMLFVSTHKILESAIIYKFPGSMPNRLRHFHVTKSGGLRKLRVVMDVLNHMDVSKVMAVVTVVTEV